jgi:hypothetical protein
MDVDVRASGNAPSAKKFGWVMAASQKSKELSGSLTGMYKCQRQL